MQHVVLGYSKTIETASINLTIGAYWTNSMADTQNVQAYNTTQRFLIVLEDQIGLTAYYLNRDKHKIEKIEHINTGPTSRVLHTSMNFSVSKRFCLASSHISSENYAFFPMKENSVLLSRGRMKLYHNPHEVQSHFCQTQFPSIFLASTS